MPPFPTPTGISSLLACEGIECYRFYGGFAARAGIRASAAYNTDSSPSLTRLWRVLGEYKDARSDVCILDRTTDGIVLLVQDKCIGGPIHAYPRLIAAYQAYQMTRVASGLPRLPGLVVPSVLLDGTSPTFYKVPLTEELVRCVERGKYPHTPTIVAVHIPDLPRPHRRRLEGMKPLDNRQIILECYEAFKAFIP
ncbi:hypothetical protein DFH06DRAFT_997333 [Mycena polygramma]|nr:hypothetical protein DFH06DRAFT_997333 [Mycena polygramma]